MDDWLIYNNRNATRNRDLDPALVAALSFLPELGLQMEVFSGGQPSAAEGGGRVGSVRHDHGRAADVYFTKDGRRLDWANPADLPYFEEIVRRGRAAGITGFGAGDGYMGPGSMHIGFGNPGVWGAGGKGANAADWLRAAYEGSPAGTAPTGAYASNALGGSYGHGHASTTGNALSAQEEQDPSFRFAANALDPRNFMTAAQFTAGRI